MTTRPVLDVIAREINSKLVDLHLLSNLRWEGISDLSILEVEITCIHKESVRTSVDAEVSIVKKKRGSSASLFAGVHDLSTSSWKLFPTVPPGAFRYVA